MKDLDLETCNGLPAPVHPKVARGSLHRTGVTVWGNQAANWHIAGPGDRTAGNLRRLYKDDAHLPKHAVFGDGNPIPDADVHQILGAKPGAEVVVPWQRGDVVVCDNQRHAHGRRSLKGERRVLVALA
jgi:hypothetical protein